MHDSALSKAEKVNAGHTEHVRSAVAEPGSSTDEPGLQTVNTVHEKLLTMVLNVPGGQLAQLRASVAVRFCATYWPGEQVPASPQMRFDREVGAMSSTSSAVHTVVTLQLGAFLASW